MKKYLSIFLCTALLIGFTGCTNQSAAESAPTGSAAITTSPTQHATEPDAPVVSYNLPLSAISVPLVKETVTAEDGTVLFQYSYQNVSVILPDAEVAEAVLLNLLNTIDASTSTANSILAAAEDAYTGQSGWYPYNCSIIYNPVRLDSNVLSLYGASVVFDGTSHSSSKNISVSYDLSTGMPLTLKGILYSDYSADDLCTLINEGLSSYPQNALYPDYQDLIHAMFAANTPTENWYLSPTGLCFYFSPYEIAPYSTGTIVSEIPYEKLIGLLKDAYHPAELLECSGNITAQCITGNDAQALKGFTETCEVIIDAGGERILINTNGSISNVRLERGSYDSDGIHFIPSATVFYAATLCTENGFVIETYIPDALPDLRLTYISGGIEYSYYLLQSGKDGSILLLEAE